MSKNLKRKEPGSEILRDTSHEYDFNNDGIVNVTDLIIARNSGISQEKLNEIAAYIGTEEGNIEDEANNLEVFDAYKAIRKTGVSNVSTGSQDLGISSGAVGTRQELRRMLESYKGKGSLIQSAHRQKVIYTIDRFDGGLNLNKSPRDLSYWEACRIDCMTPSKIGRLIRLGDFGSQNAKSGLIADGVNCQENYGLHYFKLSNEKDLGASGTPTNYIAMQDGNDINIFDLSDNSVLANVITSLDNSSKPVYHNASNRVYVSDNSFLASKTYMFGIVDRRKLFPYDNSGTLAYNITGNSSFFKNKSLYHAPPVKGAGDGEIMVTGTQSGSTAIAGLTHFMNTAAASGGGTQFHGIYLNVNFEDITLDDASGIGWGGVAASQAKYYKIYASWLYDNGSETKLTGVSAANNDDDTTVDKIKATTTSAGIYQKLVVKQVIVDGAGIIASNPRVHGARFYYTEVDTNGNVIGDDKYLWAELDFRYGFKLVSEFGNWNQFEDDDDGSGHSLTTAIQVLNASNANDNTEPSGTLQIASPPQAFTYYSLNLFHQEEIKDDLMWKTSTVGNGIAFVANIKYDGREYPDTMLYSGAGETDSGSAYPMWGTFPVDSNRIEIPGSAGEITALKWINGKVLQFRKNALYIVNVEDVLAPSVENVYQGMGVHGQWAVTETSFGCAWVNEKGVYAYNQDEGMASSLTIGRIDTEDFILGQSGSDAHKELTKIGYDDRAKMLIITNTTKSDTDGYHYAYSFVTDSWCTWNGNKSQAANVKTNFAIDHDGYLTSGINDSTAFDIYKWNTSPSTTPTIDYITKDIDFNKPNLDKRLYTLYISYTGGDGQSGLNVYFRVNGKEGTDLSNGWHQLETIQDYTDPYFTTNSTAWADSSGAPIAGDAKVNIDTGLNSTSTGEVQKLAKINLRNLGTADNVDETDTGSTTFPRDYLKFARSIQFRFTGTADENFEINDISLVYKEKRIK